LIAVCEAFFFPLSLHSYQIQRPIINRRRTPTEQPTTASTIRRDELSPDAAFKSFVNWSRRKCEQVGGISRKKKLPEQPLIEVYEA
jgi:hypothetical protein